MVISIDRIAGRLFSLVVLSRTQGSNITEA